jgi:uncharacterized membrane protein YkvA (DUF1232 family)
MEYIMTKDYSKYYSASKLKAKLMSMIGRIAERALRQVLILLAMLQSDQVPVYAKAGIVAVLGYLVFPFDLFPDFIPGGLSDDLAAIALLLVEMAIYYNDDIDQAVDDLMTEWFG